MPVWINEHPRDDEFHMNRAVSIRVAGVLNTVGFRWETYQPTTRTFVLHRETNIQLDNIRRTVTYQQL